MTLCHVAEAMWCGSNNTTCYYWIWKISIQFLYLLFCLDLVLILLKLN